MASKRQPRSRNAILIVGSVMALYLAMLISVGYIGQMRLRESLREQEQLSVEKQATAIGYFLHNQQESVDELSESQQIRTFLANRDLGMSMRYGLRASLNAISRAFEHARTSKMLHGHPVFSRIAFVENNGHVLLEVGDTNIIDAQQTYAVHETRKPGQIDIRAGVEGPILTFTSTVLHKGKPAGYLAAKVDAITMLRPLLALGGTASNRHRTALLDPRDKVVVAGAADWVAQYKAVQESGKGLLTASVEGSQLRVVDLPHSANSQGFLTSPLFLAALALMGLPLVGGVAYLLKLNNRNLVLTTRYEATSEQRATLRKQNDRLQSEIDKRLESEQKLAYQANYDQLTGLPNRNLALDRLTQALKRAKRDGQGVLTMFLDLDRFKQVNDSLGHAAGDELLREAAQRLESSVRDSDTVSRLGGDEFLIICPEVTDRADWEKRAQQMLKILASPFYIGDHEFFIGASIGIAGYPQGGMEPQKLLKNADIAMYAAKERGRNRYCYYDPSMDAAAIEGVRLENNLRHALERNEFHLVFQPIVEITSGKTICVEALLRWTNPELGDVSPEKFIPVAEETGLIHDIGEWVLIEACRTMSTFDSDHGLRVAVNLSSKQFNRPGRLLECVLFALRDSGLVPSQLELEITETILIDDRQEIADLIDQLDRIGVRLSIDDFGTGYSALNYLQRFPFDVLKIDRSFTSQVPGSKANSSLIRAIIAMAHALDLEVVAEGIETREQAGFLLVYHCEYGQGYLYSRPMPAKQLQIQLVGEQAITA